MTLCSVAPPGTSRRSFRALSISSTSRTVYSCQNSPVRSMTSFKMMSRGLLRWGRIMKTALMVLALSWSEASMIPDHRLSQYSWFFFLSEKRSEKMAIASQIWTRLKRPSETRTRISSAIFSL